MCMDTNPTPRLLAFSEVMVLLGVSRSTLYRMIDAGTLTRVKVGQGPKGGARITAESVDTLVSGDAA